MPTTRIDRKSLQQDTRLVLLERAEEEHDERITKVEETCGRIERTLTAVVVRVGIYAGVGSVVGGAAVAGIITIVVKNLGGG